VSEIQLPEYLLETLVSLVRSFQLLINNVQEELFPQGLADECCPAEVQWCCCAYVFFFSYARPSCSILEVEDTYCSGR
jgi:hypothetical protein